MTLRGAGLVLGGPAAVAIGWFANWPEISVLGVSALLVVVVALLVAGGRSPVELSMRSGALRAVRGEAAQVQLTLVPRRRRRALRLVEGDLARPRRTVPVPGGAGRLDLTMPVSTERRGRHRLGPFLVVRGDPWSVVRTVVGTGGEGELLVRPRTHPVRTGFAVPPQVGATEALTRRRGDDHFFALRDYVLGDEPRNVHWRSSARSGRLVVRQKVAAAAEGVMIVLDTDQTAYAAGGEFAEGFVEERFERAVEVVASLCLARVAAGDTVTLITTARRQARSTPENQPGRLLDALAVVESVPPMEAAAEQLPTAARQARIAQLIVVTGSPTAALQGAVRACHSLRPVLVRVNDEGASVARPVAGVTTLDVDDVRGLA